MATLLRTWNSITRWMLRTPQLRRLVERQVCELRFTGRRTGRQVVLPVMYAERGSTLVVLVGGPDSKTWWRNFRRRHHVEVLLRGIVREGTGVVVGPGDPGRDDARQIYAARYKDLPPEDDPFVVVTLLDA
jgi:hypothetical protein